VSDALEFFDQDEKAGFRLHRAEVFNWGTFHDKVWTLLPGGENTLLTGDIGSGKSTLVDAVTTLLVPAQRITYNKAAGAENRERNLRSYILGYYKSERGEPGLSARAVSLRDPKSYSVILAHFRNEGYDTDVTLAQVFWFRDAQQPPARFYMVADRALSIVGDFSGFGADLADLRKRLRTLPGVELFEAFPAYGDAFRRRFGIENPQALELFNQTVSMKSVGNLTDFVREHMLEPADGADRVGKLIGHFDDLSRAHEAILKAKDQIARLQPLVEDGSRHTEIQAQVLLLKTDREALRSWFAGIKAELLEKRLSGLIHDAQRLAQKRSGLEEIRGQHRTARDEVRRALSENGGDRLERLEAEIADAHRERQRRRERSDRYDHLAGLVGLDPVKDSDAFARNRSSLGGRLGQWKDEEAELQNKRSEDEGTFRDLRKDHAVVAAELDSLRRRPTNIPREQVVFRERLCSDLALDPEELPFVGELVAVRPEASGWEPAAERVLRNFALSLLVPDEAYGAVTGWVDSTHLGGRLVYYRVRPGNEGRGSLQPDSLVAKLAVRADSRFRAWVEAQLAQRFDYVCCETLDRFRRERQALTLSGQTKGGGERHEKDDRHPLGDRSRFVLGWSNGAKIRVLETREKALAAAIGDQGSRLAEIQIRLSQLQEKLQGAAVLDGFIEFSEIDWRSSAKLAAELEHERDTLRKSSDLLAVLGTRLTEVEAALAEVETSLEALTRDEGGTAHKIELARASLEEASAVSRGGEGWEPSYARLAEGHPALLGAQLLTVESCDNRERDYRDHLQALIDAEEKKAGRLRDKIIQSMQEFRTAYPLETRELDVGLAALDGYRDLLVSLSGDDLPRFERRFKELLNENTIREVANFQSQLARDRQTIKERIDFINQSLTQIDYNPGRYIRLEADPNSDPEIREFLQELRACTENTLSGGDELYSEAKFLQVKKIIERFRGRPDLADIDRRWTEKVTDVRQAFVFSASERWKEDDKEHEHYTDSAGKSGGQKEKLAYTVLAASLAYQFGLEWGAVRSRTFRFVVIDEAFGRGSDESTRYGLELFQRLNLQLLIVTPLQKISVIEPYVSSVGFVSNDEGRDSRLRNLTIEEYRREKAARTGAVAP